MRESIHYMAFIMFIACVVVMLYLLYINKIYKKYMCIDKIYFFPPQGPIVKHWPEHHWNNIPHIFRAAESYVEIVNEIEFRL